MHLNADARIYAAFFDGSQIATLELEPARKAYVQVLRGTLSANGLEMGQGDALLMQGENRLVLDQAQAAEVLVFDLAA